MSFLSPSNLRQLGEALVNECEQLFSLLKLQLLLSKIVMYPESGVGYHEMISALSKQKMLVVPV